MSKFAPISEAIEHIRSGKMVIVVDDEQRENEGDLIVAAEHITETKMIFLIRHTGGVVCLPLSNEVADSLDLPAMVERNTSKLGTPFTISIEAKEGVTTGISAKDRTRTIQTAINPVARPDDLSRPGHIFPLRAQDGGVLKRAGHTEAAIDLCKLAGLREGAVLSELMHDDGTMMRLPALADFAKEHDILMISIEDLIAYRRKTETFIRREAETDLDTLTGTWRMIVYSDALDGCEHVAMIKGKINPMKPVLVRVHSECLTGDTFHSVQCDCGLQLQKAMDMINEEGSGVILYLRQEGRGIGLINKVKAYALQSEENLDTVEANEKLGLAVDLREYGVGAQILKDVGVGNLRLLTNNPKKIIGLDGYGLHIKGQVPLESTLSHPKQHKYLQTKKEKMGHNLKDA